MTKEVSEAHTAENLAEVLQQYNLLRNGNLLVKYMDLLLIMVGTWLMLSLII